MHIDILLFLVKACIFSKVIPVITVEDPESSHCFGGGAASFFYQVSKCFVFDVFPDFPKHEVHGLLVVFFQLFQIELG